MQRLTTFLGHGDRVVFWTTATLAGALLLMMSILVIWMVVARYLFNAPVFWGDEMSRYLMFSLVMIGSAIAIRLQQHPRLTFLLTALPARLQITLEWLIDTIVIGTLLVILIQGALLAIDESIMRTPSLRVSYLWVYLSYPLGAGLSILQVFGRHFGPDRREALGEIEGVV